MINIRFFGSSKCVNCAEALKILSKEGLEVRYIDALNPKKNIQDFCDKHNVDELPHIQFIKDNSIIYEHIGEINESFKNLIKFFKTQSDF